MAKKPLDPNLAALLDSIRATVGGAQADVPAPAAEDQPAAAPAALAADALAAAAPPAAAPVGPGPSVEAFFADLIRPQVKAWLDANLPELVQKITAEEIARLIDKP